MRPFHRLLPRDPRLLQIAFLASFLVLGVAFLGLQIEPWMPPLLLASTCAVQWACERLLRLPSSGFRSPLITGLGLSLLLRTDAIWVPPLAAAIGIGAKYLVRVRGKHVFNPGMLGLTSCILLTGHAWCSPSQWGEGMVLLAWFAVLGLAVVSRSFRADVSLAFLGSWVLLKLGRVLWLGQRPAVLGHQLLVGSLILFTFFMISDPKTTPDRRSARIGFGVAVAVLAFVLQHQAWVMNAPVWALLALSPAVPLLDRLFPASRFTWPSGQPPQGVLAVPAPAVRRVAPLLVLPLLVLLHPLPASAFCGFYVGKADTQLFNESSQVALVRDGDRTVLTMSNDYRGPLTEFALVVPVPTVLEREQIHVGDRKLLEHLDAYSAPRLVEYFDPDPCMRYYPMAKAAAGAPSADMARSVAEKKRDEALGVRVEARYSVGEYDILILGAKQSEGLEIWLRENGYRVPGKAAAALQPYIRQDMKFFVAKVNLEAQRDSGVQYLRPLQIAYESKKFMLPIRLGMANAAGPQDLIVYALTRRGRVESTNYRTARVPSDVNIPLFVKSDFGKFYQDAFAHSVDREDRRAVFTEYVWDMGWCDPCAAQPLSREELRQLGVFWLEDGQSGSLAPTFRRGPSGGPTNVLLTRLHVRYDGAHFPEDLVFQETSDRSNFQARYILQHPFQGASECSAMDDYRERLRDRRSKEAETLASLTGWSMKDIRTKMGPDGAEVKNPRPWYRRLWNE
ncbi:MAG TPA: DUF2330 domain-containing protein [Myxococcaceae bacterium]|nr:DUF2330 domain-containing protein [Myxococcaceae bacterium]